MNRRKLTRAMFVALGFAFLTAGAATFLDWSKNPGGIFRDSTGTNWAVVWETAVSWFVPVLLIVVVAQTVWLLLARR